MMKSSEIKAEVKRLSDVPGMHLPSEMRKEFLNASQSAECEKAEKRIEELKTTNAEHVNRVGEKLKRLRELMIADKKGDEFARFRFCSDRYESQGFPKDGYKQEGYPAGGVYAQDEDVREAFIDAKLKEQEPK